MIIEYALGHPGESSYNLMKIADIMEKYGKKIALVGRIISNLGDTITGFGRWLRKRGETYTGEIHSPLETIDQKSNCLWFRWLTKHVIQKGPRAAIAQLATELSEKNMGSSEANVASKIMAATCKEVAENKAIPGEWNVTLRKEYRGCVISDKNHLSIPRRTKLIVSVVSSENEVPQVRYCGYP